MLINRDIIKNNRYPIDRIKNLLRDAGAIKGDLITISIMEVNDSHIASIFACAEMGLKIIILDSPATLESLPYTKLALHGPSQFYIYDSTEDTDHIYNGLHDEMMKRYGGIPIDVNEKASEDYFHVNVSPDDPFLMSSTSGTTKPSRPVLFSHKEVYHISKRNIDIFGFDEDSVVCHSRNLHHASALLTSLLPSLMASDNHYHTSIGHDLSGDDHILLMGYHGIRKRNTTHVMIPNKATLIDFLETVIKPFNTTLNINMSGFTLDQSFVELAEKYNVRFQSHYGSIDTAIPLLINFVDKDSVVKENCLGVLPDDFYQLNGTEVMCDLWDEPRYMEDKLKHKDGEFFIKSRKETSGRYLMELLRDCPEEINLDLFFQDTKLNMEQLRGHIHEIKK